MRQVRDRLASQSGQTLILFVFAMPLLIALIALVVDGSNLFAHRRVVQNAADAAAFAVARDLPTDSTTASAAAQSWVDRNMSGGIATTTTPYKDAACKATPGCTGNPNQVEVSVDEKVSTFFAGAAGLFNPHVSARAVAGWGVPGAAGNVSPVAIKESKAPCGDPSDPSCDPTRPRFNTTVTLDFGANFDSTEYVLLDLNSPTPGSVPVPCSNEPVGYGNPTSLNTYIRDGFPGLLPADAWYSCNNNSKTQKNGLKQALDDFASKQPQQPLLVPVFNVEDAATLSVHVIGFAAFLIDTGSQAIKWTGNTHTLSGQFTTFLATGVIGRCLGTCPDFGVHVISLDE